MVPNKTPTSDDTTIATMEDQLRDHATPPGQVAVMLLTSVAASAAMSATRVNGEIEPLRAVPGANAMSAVRANQLRTRLAAIRAGIRDLSVAHTDLEIMLALDGLRENCSTR